jgi:hypothetical protein
MENILWLPQAKARAGVCCILSVSKDLFKLKLGRDPLVVFAESLYLLTSLREANETYNRSLPNCSFGSKSDSMR